MPTYEYECSKGHVTEEFHTMTGKPATSKCPLCKLPTKSIISAVRGFVSFPAGKNMEYVSPASGRYITSTRARRDDMARTGCREYEGFDSEAKEAKKRVKEQERKSDEKLHDTVSKAYHALPPSKKKVLAG